MRIRKRLSIVLLSALAAVLVVIPVLAYLYRAPFTVNSTSVASYTMLPVSVASPNTWMAANGFMSATALDTRIETLGGAAKPHMVTGTAIFTVVPVPASSQTNLYFTTGNTPAASMSIVPGYGGYITVADAAALELGNNFESEFSGGIDTSAGASKNLINKQVAFTTTVSGAGTITSSIYAAPANETLAPNGAGSVAGAPIPNLTGAPTHWQANLTNDGHASTVFNTTNSYCWDVYSMVDSAIASGVVNGVTVSIVVTGDGGAALSVKAKTALYTGSGGLQYGGDNIILFASYGLYQTFSTTYLLNPITGTYWTWADINALEAGVALEGDGGTTGAYSTQIYVTVNYSAVAKSVSGAVATGTHVIKTTADTVNLKLIVDTIQLDSVALAGATVIDNANPYLIDQTNVMPYMNYYKHTVGGTLIVWYQPVTIISGTTLLDRQGAAEDGTFTFGFNPASVTATLGGLISSSQSSSGATTAVTNIDTLPEVTISDWFTAPDIPTKLLTNPLRGLVTLVSDNTTLTELQTWRLYGIILVLFVLVLTAMSVRGHYLITGIATGVAIGVCVAATVFPLWALVFMIGAVLGGIVAERSPVL